VFKETTNIAIMLFYKMDLFTSKFLRVSGPFTTITQKEPTDKLNTSPYFFRRSRNRNLLVKRAEFTSDTPPIYLFNLFKNKGIL
jgi:hypothetical protein